jgi:phosphohistidine phosphatase
MKQLLLIRHAKSSWDSAEITDFERPLNERGKRDAGTMAGRLQSRGITIDLIISSPAKRAKKTAEIFAAALGYPKQDIRFIDKLYEPTPEVFYEVLNEIGNEDETVAVFSHNPSITSFASSLTNIRIDNMPTCAIFGLKMKENNSTDFRAAEKTFWLFDYPKADHEE